MTITPAFDLDSGSWILTATSYGQTMPAGPRLFRSQPWPDIRFEHETKEAAEADAEKLRKYLDSLPVAKTKKKSTAKNAYSE